ncbi:MFS transporter [Lonepinella sp. BR2882]|uniref:MFS transporter n=1 Tax=Lonepinella sp. BR2882 TaxID=3095283 RepID=UPI003F6DB8A4
MAHLEHNNYIFKPHEMPMMGGSPATPEHPTSRKIIYIIIAIMAAVIGGFQNGLFLASSSYVQGDLGLTGEEAGWVSVAYYMSNVWYSILLFRFREHFGMKLFLVGTMLGLVAVNTAQLFVHSYEAMLVLRLVNGFAAGGMMPIAVYYFMQVLPAPMRIAGALLAMVLFQITSSPLAKLVAPYLLYEHDLSRLYLFQLAITLITTVLIFRWHLPETLVRKVFEKIDAVSFVLYGSGLALICAFLTQGRIVWWDKDYLGVWLLLGCVLVIFALLVETHRNNPLLYVKWLTSRHVVAFFYFGVMMKLLLSEQSVGATGFLTAVGLGNEQLRTLYVVMCLSMLVGIVSFKWLRPTNVQAYLMTALLLIAIGAFMDTHAGTQTSAVNFYVSQALMSFAIVLFIAPLMQEGLMRALANGMHYIVSFVAVFSLVNTMGSLLGNAILSAFVTIRTKVHLSVYALEFSQTDPIVAARISSVANQYKPLIGDTALRQATAGSKVAGEVSQLATITAYNELFAIVGYFALLAFVWQFGKWLIYRRRGTHLLHQPLTQMQQMMQKSH